MTKYWYCTGVYGIGHFNTFNPLNTELKPICHLLTLLGVPHILHVARIRVNLQCWDMYCNTQPTCHTWVEAIHAAAFNCILVHKMRSAFNFLEMKVNSHFASWSCFEREQNGCHKPRQYSFIKEFDIPS